MNNVIDPSLVQSSHHDLPMNNQFGGHTSNSTYLASDNAGMGYTGYQISGVNAQSHMFSHPQHQTSTNHSSSISQTGTVDANDVRLSHELSRFMNDESVKDKKVHRNIASPLFEDGVEPAQHLTPVLTAQSSVPGEFQNLYLWHHSALEL
jgi:hypothetical protein